MWPTIPIKYFCVFFLIFYLFFTLSLGCLLATLELCEVCPSKRLKLLEGFLNWLALTKGDF